MICTPMKLFRKNGKSLDQFLLSSLKISQFGPIAAKLETNDSQLHLTGRNGEIYFRPFAYQEVLFYSF